jgi:hypothetical protein
MVGLAAVRRGVLEEARARGHVLAWKPVEVQVLHHCRRCWTVTVTETEEASRVLCWLAEELDQALCGASRRIRGSKSGRHRRRGRASPDAGVVRVR